MKKVSNLQEVLHHQLQTIYDAENQLIKALPVLKESTSNTRLKKIFSSHLTETLMHKERISGMAQDLNFSLRDITCYGMQRLIEQAIKFCNVTGKTIIKDTGLLVYAQQIEQYEVASYTNMIGYAKALDYNYLVNFLQRSKTEEVTAYRNLNCISVNTFTRQTRNYFAA